MPVLIALLAFAIQDKPPSITYPSTRVGKQWINIGGMQVAVDKGISWKGTTAYLSLSCELLAVDDKTGKTLWSADVGAFWNAMTFVEHIYMDGKKVWAVELAPDPRTREGANLRQYHELLTGKKIEPQVESMDAWRVDLPKWSGRDSNLATPLTLLVETEETWKTKVLKPMFEGRQDAPAFGAIDFTKHRVLVLSDGASTNCNGTGGQAWALDGRLLLRLERHTFQTCGPDGGAVRTRPFGIFVLPRTPATVVVERNAQRYIGGPEIWKETLRFESPLK